MKLRLLRKQLPAMFSLLVAFLTVNVQLLQAQTTTDPVAKPKPPIFNYLMKKEKLRKGGAPTIVTGQKELR